MPTAVEYPTFRNNQKIWTEVEINLRIRETSGKIREKVYIVKQLIFYIKKKKKKKKN